jgi:hypothetical protein
MDLEYYGLFLVGSILVSLGIVVLAMAALLINHLYVRYWKTIQLVNLYNYDLRPMMEEANTITVTANTTANTK